MNTTIEPLSVQYPHLAQAFEHLPQGDKHLQRLMDLNASWQQIVSTEAMPGTIDAQGTHGPRQDVVVSETRPRAAASDTFDIIYAGGGLNLLNAAVMTLRYGLRVLVFDRYTVGAVHREWNISRDELQELLDVGLLTAAELETIIQREYSRGLVSFHSEHIQVPSTSLYLHDVLNIAVDADRLTALCMHKIQSASTRCGLPNEIVHGTTFVHSAVQVDTVTVDVIDHNDVTKSYQSRLLIDGMGSTSPIASQLNHGRQFSLVCPTVGTVARGYKSGTGKNQINAELGEVLVSTEDTRNGRQLIWETFPVQDDQVAIYLFYYAETGQKIDLLTLYDDFFALLPSYKECSEVDIVKPVYGFIPAGYNISLPWHKKEKVLAYDRVLSLGDAAAFQSPLTFCGFGSYVRNLRRITTLLHQALRDDCLHAEDLSAIRASEAVPEVARAFSKFMIARSDGNEVAWQVNETLNVFCRVLQKMGERPTNDFFKDRIRWRDYTRLVVSTPFYYPRIFSLALHTLGRVEIIHWIYTWLQLGLQSLAYRLSLVLRPLLKLSEQRLPATLLRSVIGSRHALRLRAWSEAMKQEHRNRMRSCRTTTS